jgi:hypothetical protein
MAVVKCKTAPSYELRASHGSEYGDYRLFGYDDVLADNIFTDISEKLLALSTLEMEAADSSETLVLLHYTALHPKRQ